MTKSFKGFGPSPASGSSKRQRSSRYSTRNISLSCIQQACFAISQRNAQLLDDIALKFADYLTEDALWLMIFQAIYRASPDAQAWYISQDFQHAPKLDQSYFSPPNFSSTSTP